MELREIVVKKIIEMSKEQVVKVLIFMAGMEAEHNIMNAEQITCEYKVQ